MAKGPGETAAGRQLRKWTQVYNRRLPILIAEEAKEHFIANFDQEGFDGRPWQRPGPGRERPNLSTLEQSAELRGNIEVQRAKPMDITIGTDGIVYADIHNRGGRIPVTPRSRRFFWAKFKETGLEFWRNMALNTKGFIDMPQRKFIGNSRLLNNKIIRIINRELKKLGR